MIKTNTTAKRQPSKMILKFLIKNRGKYFPGSVIKSELGLDNNATYTTLYRLKLQYDLVKSAKKELVPEGQRTNRNYDVVYWKINEKPKQIAFAERWAYGSY